LPLLQPFRASALFLLFCSLSFSSRLIAQEKPYFVTYDQFLEEPRNLEIEYFSTFGTQRGGNQFHSYWLELECGATAWWTTEFYLDAQTTFNDSTLATGFRWENRLRPLKREHFINPVLYVEYEHVNGADKLLKEVEGHDIESDFSASNSLARREIKNELELKLILGSNFKGWNVSENFLSVKNLAGEPWEFGYAVGASRPLTLKAAARRCNFCPQNFVAGAELYGGLGNTSSFGLPETSHYFAPVVAWNMPSGWTLRASPTFGLNHNSYRFLIRWGVAKEFSGFGDLVKKWFGGRS